MARRSVQWRHDFSFPGDPPTPMARMTDADDRRALPPRRPPVLAENRLAPRAGEEDFRWLQAPSPGSPESGSGTPSPQLWAQHPHYGRLYPASAGSSPSRAQAIAGYRREMLDLVRGLPEASYELSLRDIVESRGPFPLPTPPPPPPTQPHATAPEYDEQKKHTAAAAMHTMDDEQSKKQTGDKKQGKARKQRTMRRTRSRSMERSVSLDTGLLIKLFMPLSVGRKQKVSPKPTTPAGAAKESKKKTKKMKEEEEEWWKKSEFSEAGSSSRTSSTGSSNSNGSASASRNNVNGRVNGGTNPQAPARSRSRKRIGCYGFFRPNKGTNGVIEE